MKRYMYRGSPNVPLQWFDSVIITELYVHYAMMVFLFEISLEIGLPND